MLDVTIKKKKNPKNFVKNEDNKNIPSRKSKKYIYNRMVCERVLQLEILFLVTLYMDLK